jgi:hypothetical protein
MDTTNNAASEAGMSELGRHLVTRAAGDPQALATAARVISSGERSNDACLQARRYLEHQWFGDPDTVPASDDYRQAASALERAGRGTLAAVLDSIASTEDELAATSRAWSQRATAHPDTGEGAHLAQLIATGNLILAGTGPEVGADGAWYQPGWFGDGDPVVLVTTTATRELAAGFYDADARDRWLRDRHRADVPRPLADPQVEHLPRVSREEQLLSFMLRHPGWMPDLEPQARARLWTADCRHEIAGAQRAAGGKQPAGEGGTAAVRDVAAELRRRMLRAPGWAAAQVGWPDGHWAERYLHRLAMTSVTESTARHAFQVLTGLRTAPSALTALDQGRLPAARHRHDVAPARPPDPEFLLRLGPGIPRPYSVGSRMRITGQAGPEPRP